MQTGIVIFDDRCPSCFGVVFELHPVDEGSVAIDGSYVRDDLGKAKEYQGQKD